MLKPNLENQPYNFRRWALGCLGIIISIALQAQMPAQKMYYGSQWAGYYEREWRKNNFGVKRFGTGVPIGCKAASFQQASLWELGETFYKRSIWADAVRAYGAYIFTDSSFCDPYFRLAQCLAAENDLESALRVLNIAEKKFPCEPMVYLALGQLAILTGSAERGLSCYERLKALDQANPEGYFGCGMALAELGRNREALSNIEKAVLIAPGT